jgi:hypothetical protein
MPHQPLGLPDDGEPLDAIVIDGTVFKVRPEDVYRPPPVFGFQPPPPAQYVVPSRFGMSGILGIMTGLAVLFGFFRIYNCHPAFYLFFGVEAIVICLAQMFYGKTPRAASAGSGAVLLPLFLIVGVLYFRPRDADELPCMVIGSVPIGAFLGYLTGTLAAGVFLVMDAAERLLTGELASARNQGTVNQ